MKTKTVILVLFVMFVSTNIFSQKKYYYYKGEKKVINIDRKHVNIFTKIDFQKASIVNLNIKEFDLMNTINGKEKWATIEFETQLTEMEYLQKINALKNNPNILGIGTHFLAGTHTVGTSNLFYIKLKTQQDIEVLKAYASQKLILIDHQNAFMPLWYCLKTTKKTAETSLELTNYLSETGRFAEVDPAFILPYTFDPQQNINVNDTNETFTNFSCPPTDPLYTQQWGVIAVNACGAWNNLTHNTTGSGTKVAVIDSGIQLNHTDLSTNISPLSYDMDSSYATGLPQSSQLYLPHATHVAGIIGAAKNSIQVVGVAPDAKLMSVSTRSNNPNLFVQMELFANGISWAWQNGADVINNSWGVSAINYPDFYSRILENSIITAIASGRDGKGSVVVFSSGNDIDTIKYPANFNDDILVVGAIRPDWLRWPFSSFGEKLDITAPGLNVLSTFPTNATGLDTGTSMAAPHVSGVAALVISANPCLSALQVRNIIEATARKNPQQTPVQTYGDVAGRTNGTWNEEVGYGMVNANNAVQMALQMGSPTLDLMIRDSPNDIGVQPNTRTGAIMWRSDDIWVRNQPDNGLVHQNPEYSTVTPNYAYVRVTNKSCMASTGTELLKFYWAKASTALRWPESWDGQHHFAQGPIEGAPLTTTTLPILQPGEERIIQIEFFVPNPADYLSVTPSDYWHFCLLARIKYRYQYRR